MLHFNVIYKCANCYVAKRKTIARHKRRFFRNDISVSYFGALMEKRVFFFSIFVNYKSNENRAVGVIFNCFHHKWDIIFIKKKIHIAIKSLMSTSFVASGNSSAIIASGASLETTC